MESGQTARLSHRWRRLGLIALAVLVIVGMTVLFGYQKFAAQPKPAIMVDHPVAPFDTSLAVHVTGLRPGQQVTLRANTSDQLGATWSASATFNVDTSGIVDLATARPTSGSYSTADSMGLFWSMTAAERGAPTGVGFIVQSSGEEVTLTAEIGGHRVASSHVTRIVTPPGVSSQPQNGDAGFRGEYFVPSGSPRHEALLLLGGSEGGLAWPLLATTLAGYGYTILELAYFGLPGLPDDLENIPLEYFVRGLQWLRAQPAVDPSHVLVLGISRGSEAALLLGSMFPHLVQGVVALVPSSVVNPGIRALGDFVPVAWTLGGKALPTVSSLELGDPSPAGNPAAIIPVGQIRGPVFLVAGGNDHLWPSSAYARASTTRLENKNDTFVHQLLDYPAAGHLVGALLPYLPGPGPVVPTRFGALDFGGTRLADAAGKADAWPKVLGFLSQAA